MSIEISGVSRFFGSTCAVQDVTMSVPPGSVTGLVGSNGAGKTTLLLMLAALLAPDSGTIRVAGLDPLAQPREVHQAVGWMPDAFGTWDSLTCTEILLTFAAAQGLDGATAARRCAETLSAVHLSEMARTPARVLSRGQKQRLGLARALVHSPRVLLLDEPAAGMDPRSRADLRVLLRDLASDGATILISSHILPELEQMIDGVVFMSRGAVVSPPGGASPSADGVESADGASAPARPSPLPQPLRRHWEMRALDPARLAAWAASEQAPAEPGQDGALLLPAADDAAAAALLRSAVEAGVEVTAFAPRAESLEAAYLAMEGDRR